MRSKLLSIVLINYPKEHKDPSGMRAGSLIVEKIKFLIPEFKNNELKKLAYMLGSGNGVNKEEMVKGIVERCNLMSGMNMGEPIDMIIGKPVDMNTNNIHHTGKKKNLNTSNTLHENLYSTINVVAVDMGIANFSFSKFNVTLSKKHTSHKSTGDTNGFQINGNCINEMSAFTKKFDPLDMKHTKTVVYPQLTEWVKYDLTNKYANILNPNYPDPYYSKKSGKIKTIEKSKTIANSKYIQFNPQTVDKLCDELVKLLFPMVTSQIIKLKSSMQSLLPRTVVLLEHQRTRTGSSSNVLETVYRNSVIEYVLFGKLTRLFQNTEKHGASQIQLSDARKMCDYWVKDTKEMNKKTSKNPRLQLCYNIFDSLQNYDKPVANLKEITKKMGKIDINDCGTKTKPQLFSASPNFITKHPQLFQNNQNKNKTNKTRFYNALGMTTHDNGTMKDDDLCDSLLHGIAWIQWFEFYTNLADMVIKLEKLDVETGEMGKTRGDSVEWKKIQKLPQYQDQVTRLKNFVVTEWEKHESLLTDLTKINLLPSGV